MVMDTHTEERENQEETSGGNSESALVERHLTILKPKHPMELLLKKGGFSVAKVGEVVQGVVIEKKGAELFIDLGTSYGTGIVFGREFRAAGEIIKKLNPEDPISGKVIEFDNEKGYVELSLKEAGADQTWADLKKKAETGEVFELPVLDANRGGLLLDVKGIKGFLPASQLSQANYPRVEGGDKEKIFQELQKLVGKSLRVKILDMNMAEEKLIFTEKGQTSEDVGRVLAKYKVGDVVEGEITGVVDFGAFLKFDDTGLEGLIHISEIDWALIENPREVLKTGDHHRARIIDIQGDKVSLSLKQLKEDPWAKIAEKYQKGDVIKGTVTKFNPFGAFVALNSEIHPVRNGLPHSSELNEKTGDSDQEPEKASTHISHGIQGLLHISEFGTETKMREELERGKEYEFKILLVDPKEHRMSLGIIRQPMETEGKKDDAAIEGIKEENNV